MIYRYLKIQYNKIFDGFTAEFKILDYKMTLDQAIEERLYESYDLVGVWCESLPGGGVLRTSWYWNFYG